MKSINLDSADKYFCTKLGKYITEMDQACVGESDTTNCATGCNCYEKTDPCDDGLDTSWMFPNNDPDEEIGPLNNDYD